VRGLAIAAVGIVCGCGRLGFDPHAGADAGADAASCPGVDLDTDDRNCGACGHDCLGGACEIGTCQPVMIADTQGSPRGILVDATHVYWTAAQAIRRADKDTRTVETVTTYTGSGFRMIAFGDYVYWVTRDSGLVARAPMGADVAAETIATGQGDVGGVATDGTNVYWDTYPIGNLYAGTVNGTTPTALLASPTANLTGLRLVDSTIYYIEIDVGLQSIPVTGGTPTLVVPDAGSWEFALDGDDVFLANQQPFDRVVHATLSGAPPTLLGPALDPWGIVVDDLYVYCANENGDTITRVPRAGGTTEILATSPQPVGIAVDDRAVYWTTYGGGVFVVAK
jgi:hypothetical protein